MHLGQNMHTQLTKTGIYGDAFSKNASYNEAGDYQHPSENGTKWMTHGLGNILRKMATYTIKMRVDGYASPKPPISIIDQPSLSKGIR